MILRPATAGDARAIATLELELFGTEAWMESSVRAELVEADRFVAVATEQQEVLGYVTTGRAGEVADVHRIGVRPGHRRRGIARALLAAAADRARADGARRMLLEVGSRNTAARSFYTEEGFAEVGRRRRYYRDGSDAVVMERRP